MIADQKLRGKMKWLVTGWILLSITGTFILTDSIKRQDITTEVPWWRSFREKFIQTPNNVDKSQSQILTKEKLGFSRPIIDIEQLKEFYRNRSQSEISTATTTTLLSVTEKPVKEVQWKPHHTPNYVLSQQLSTSHLNSKDHLNHLMMGSLKDNPHRFPFVSGSRHNIWGGVSNSLGNSLVTPISTVSHSYFLTSPFLEASHEHSKSHQKTEIIHTQKIPKRNALIAKLLKKILADRLTENYHNKLSNR